MYQVKEILTEYAAYLPLTIRQIFYRLVGAHDYAKTEQSYKRLAEHLNRARRTSQIPWDSIRDDGTILQEPFFWESEEDLIHSFIASAKSLRFDRQAGQATHLLFAVEAQGMVPQVQRIAEEYGIAVHSSGGFDSVTAKYEMAKRFGEYEAVEVLHLGDHDPAASIFSA